MPPRKVRQTEKSKIANASAESQNNGNDTKTVSKVMEQLSKKLISTSTPSNKLRRSVSVNGLDFTSSSSLEKFPFSPISKSFSRERNNSPNEQENSNLEDESENSLFINEHSHETILNAKDEDEVPEMERKIPKLGKLRKSMSCGNLVELTHSLRPGCSRYFLRERIPKVEPEKLQLPVKEPNKTKRTTASVVKKNTKVQATKSGKIPKNEKTALRMQPGTSKEKNTVPAKKLKRSLSCDALNLKSDARTETQKNSKLPRKVPLTKENSSKKQNATETKDPSSRGKRGAKPKDSLVLQREKVEPEAKGARAKNKLSKKEDGTSGVKIKKAASSDDISKVVTNKSKKMTSSSVAKLTVLTKRGKNKASAPDELEEEPPAPHSGIPFQPSKKKLYGTKSARQTKQNENKAQKEK